jgi:hypothetical protein
VTAEYIIGKLNLSGYEVEMVDRFMEFNQFPMEELSMVINSWKSTDMIQNYMFASSQKQESMVELNSDTKFNPVAGMSFILEMKQWGVGCGVYAVLRTTDSERLTTLGVRLKYEDMEEEGGYAYSELVPIKMSELAYVEFENDYKAIRAGAKNFKKLMNYAPANKEPLDYRMVYAALSKHRKDIISRTVSGKLPTIQQIYNCIVKEAYNVAKEIGEGVIRENIYVLDTHEMKDVAKACRCTLEKLVELLDSEGLLMTDKDKASRNKKKLKRAGDTKRYYCVYTTAAYERIQQELIKNRSDSSIANIEDLKCEWTKIMDKPNKASADKVIEGKVIDIVTDTATEQKESTIAAKNVKKKRSRWAMDNIETFLSKLPLVKKLGQDNVVEAD